MYSIKRYVIAGSLLSVMGLTGCVSQSKYDDLQAQNQQLQQQNASLTDQVASEKAALSRLQGAVKYTVNSDLLFAPGSWEIRPQGKSVISKLAAKLAPTQTNKILVNGYTDDAPIGPELKKKGVTTNLDLSQKRAQSVADFLVSQGLKADLVEAHGYGDASPVASNKTAKGRAANRRVELTLANGG
nr:OmpA family protein [uncultured Rhodopila sp.]